MYTLEELHQTIFSAVSEALKSQNIPEFKQGNVPVSLVASIYGKDSSWIRAGLIVGWLPIGIATRGGKQVTTIEEMNSKLGNISYYISPKRLWEETGYVWKGEKTIPKNF